MTQIQFVGLSPTDLINALEESLLPKLKLQISSEQVKEPDEFLTISQVCDLLKINEVTLWRWRKKNVINAYGIGESKVLFKRSEILQLIDENKL